MHGKNMKTALIFAFFAVYRLSSLWGRKWVSMCSWLDHCNKKGICICVSSPYKTFHEQFALRMITEKVSNIFQSSSWDHKYLSLDEDVSKVDCAGKHRYFQRAKIRKGIWTWILIKWMLLANIRNLTTILTFWQQYVSTWSSPNNQNIRFTFQLQWQNTWCGNKETGLLLLFISGHVDDEEEGRALTHGLPSTFTQSFIHVYWLVWPWPLLEEDRVSDLRRNYAEC